MKRLLIVGIAVAIGAAGGIAGMIAMGSLAVLFLGLAQTGRPGGGRLPVESADDRALDRLASIQRFLDEALRGGLLDPGAARVLDREVTVRRHRILAGLKEVPEGQTTASRLPGTSPGAEPAAATPPPTGEAPAAAAPAPAPERVTPPVAPPSRPSATSGPGPTERPPSSRPAPAPRPVPEAAARPTPAGPARPAAPVPAAPPRRPGVIQIGMERVWAGTKRAWKAFASDVAIHSFTYLGVLLLVVVTFVFFAFGFFGDLVRQKDLRPAVEVAIPAVLFGLAWLLRSKTGIPFTADAVGMIGALVLPIMLSATFQDGSMIPPDVNGPSRWWAYAAVGLVLALVYALASRRSAIYAYLVGPGIWAAVGAVGLFLEDGLRLVRSGGLGALATPGGFAADGISAAQMVLVAAAIAATIPVAGTLRRTAAGRRISAPLVRSALVALPFVVATAIVFAYSDAVLAGVAEPGLRDLAPAAPLASLALAAGVLTGRRAGFAWEGLGPRLRVALDRTLVAAGYLALAASWPVVSDLGVTPAWLGAGYAAFGLGIAWLVRDRDDAPVERWMARLAVVGGLGLSLLDAGATLAAWAGVAVAGAASTVDGPVRRAAGRIIGVAEGGRWPRREAAAVAAAVLVAAGPGAARLAWPAGTPWVLAGITAALAAARLVPLPVVRSLAGVPAVVTLLGAVGTASWLAAEGTIGAPALSALLGTAALLAALPAIDPGIRVPAAAGLAAASADIWLRHVLVPPHAGALVDAAVLGTLAVVAVLPAVASTRLPRRARIAAEAAGVVASAGALAAGAIDGGGLLVGLGAVAATHALLAAGAETGRSALIGFLTERAAGPLRGAIAAAPAFVVAAVLPFVAVLSGRRIPAVAAERARSGLVLAASAWVYVAGIAGLHARAMRRIAATGAVAVALLGVAVAVPSQTGSLIAVGSLTAVLWSIAALVGRPGFAAAAWPPFVGAALLAAGRAGVPAGDLHFVAYGIAVALVVAPALLWRMRHGSGAMSPWLWPPLAAGLALLPASIAFAIADRRLLGLLALGAAATYAGLGILLRSGGVTLPAAGMVAIAYAHHLEAWRSPFDDPVLWMPLAAAFAAVAAVTRRPGRLDLLDHVRPGATIAWLTTTVLALTLAAREGNADWVLLANAAVFACVAAFERRRAPLYVGVASLVAAGSLFGDGWTPLALAVSAAVAGTDATVWFRRPAAPILAGIASALAGAGFATLGVWLAWSPAETAWWSAVAAGPVAGAALVCRLRRVGGRVGLWVPWMHVLGQAGAVTVLAAAVAMGGPDGFGVIAGLALAEALLAGSVATVLLDHRWAAGSTALLAGAGAALAGWLEWGPETVAAAAGAAAVVLVVPATVLWLRRVGGRVGLWVPWMHLLAQAGAVTVASAAASLEGAALPGTLMWVALGEALVAGLIGTADRRSELIGLSAGFSAGAFAALAGWLEWGPETVAAAAGAAAVVLAVPATVLWLRRVGGRVGLWVPWMHVLAQAGAVTVLAAGRAATGDAGFAGIVCMVLLAEALPAAGAATVFLDHAWAAGATALVAGASAALARWLEWGPETVAAAAGAAAVVLVVPATVLWLRRVGGRVGLWVPWMHLLAQAGAVVTIAAAAEVVPVEGLLWIAAGVCAADAILVAVVAHTLPELELPLLSAGLALGSAALALAAIGDAPAAFAAHAFVLAAGGAAALAAVARPRGRWTLPLLVAGGGFGGLACGSTLWVFGPAANETATILLIAGAAAIALGLRSGRWWLLQSGTLLWLGPAAILAHRAFDDNPHGYVVGAAVLCLAVLEMERIRREDEGRPFPDEARYAEWALMVAPLLLAAADTVVRSTTFGLLMAAEGAVIFGWALVTQVRRRLVVGAGGTVLAIVLVVAVIAARSTARGLPTGTWLAIGAGVSILLILIGSVLEKNRVRFGRMVGRISQSLEGWR